LFIFIVVSVMHGRTNIEVIRIAEKRTFTYSYPFVIVLCSGDVW